MLNLLEHLIAFIESFFIAFIILPYEQGVLIRLGHVKKVVTPGFYLKFPFGIDRVIKENIAFETIDLPAQAFMTKDGVSVVASGIASFIICDIEKFLIEVENAQSVLMDASRGVIRQVLCQKTWEELHTGGEELDAELTKAVRKKAYRWGIKVEQVSLSDLTKSRTLRLLVSNDQQDKRMVE